MVSKLQPVDLRLGDVQAIVARPKRASKYLAPAVSPVQDRTLLQRYCITSLHMRCTMHTKDFLLTIHGHLHAKRLLCIPEM